MQTNSDINRQPAVGITNHLTIITTTTTITLFRNTSNLKKPNIGIAAKTQLKKWKKSREKKLLWWRWMAKSRPEAEAGAEPIESQHKGEKERKDIHKFITTRW